MVNFLTQIPDRDSRSPALLDFFLSCDVSMGCTVTFPPLENSDHVSISSDFLSNSHQDALFHLW